MSRLRFFSVRVILFVVVSLVVGVLLLFYVNRQHGRGGCVGRNRGDRHGGLFVERHPLLLQLSLLRLGNIRTSDGIGRAGSHGMYQLGVRLGLGRLGLAGRFEVSRDGGLLHRGRGLLRGHGGRTTERPLATLRRLRSNFGLARAREALSGLLSHLGLRHRRGVRQSRNVEAANGLLPGGSKLPGGGCVRHIVERHCRHEIPLASICGALDEIPSVRPRERASLLLSDLRSWGGTCERRKLGNGPVRNA